MTKGRMMKWRVRKDSRCSSVEHEDIRRSLEVLDSVLAEFDDCLESWDTITCDTPLTYNQSCTIFNEENPGVKLNGNVSSATFSFENERIDGSTSHDSGLSLQEQAKVVSPPPIPKRSATTKLSDRSSGIFTFPLENSQSFDSLHFDSAVEDNDSALSRDGVISTLSTKDDDEVFKSRDNHAKVHCCAKCGCVIDPVTKEKLMENKQEKDVSSSPFSEKRKIFEEKIENSKINLSPLLGRSFHASSFKVKKDTAKDSQSEPSSLICNKSVEIDRSNFTQSYNITKYSPRATKVAPPKVDGLLSLPANFHHAPNCNCKERIRQLQMKFAETRRLLKANKIKRLDNKPPSFVPPPPTTIVNVHTDSQNSIKEQPFEHSDSPSMFKVCKSSTGSINSDSLISEQNSCESYSSLDSEKIPRDTNYNEGNICNNCSKSDPLLLSETIEDLPKLLPTDALKRPHLGLSYSMEDDLSPGVKDILQSSTPKNGLSLSRTSKTTSLSTFSLSDCSLGYVSSQSDMELSNSLLKPDKVPVSTIKFSTLPEGMDLHSLPSYYGQDESSVNEHKSNQTMYRDRNFNHTSDPQLRSSSAPPLPETEKPKKKHFRGFSKKEKKEKKKNDDSVSITSHLSLDDGVILKTIDGDTNKYDAVDSGEAGVVRKRWSTLRSILGKR